MQDEQVTCRICSAPGEPDQPLFHPCKCSGTIRYIHQDCLTTWLAHSKKKTCDICKHPYSFTKVYSPDMPRRLPVVLLIRQLSRQAVSGVIFFARAVLVGSIWLAFLPWATIWTWRMYFAVGDTTAWWISDRPRPHTPPPTFLSQLANATASSNTSSPSAASNGTSSFFSHPIVRVVSSDIVSGQIIASLIVLVFVAIFLLREWISQNARPGIFEEADGPPLEDIGQQAPVVQEQPAPVLAPQAPAVNRLEEDRAHRMRALWQRPVAERMDDPMGDGRNKRARHTGDAPERPQRERRHARRGKGKHTARGEYLAAGTGLRPYSGWNSPGRSASSVNGGSESDEEHSHYRRERTRQWQEHTVQWREMGPPTPSSLKLGPEQTQFTFRATSPKQTGSVDDDEAVASGSGTGAELEQTDFTDFTEIPSRPRSTNPDVPEDISVVPSPTDEQSVGSSSSGSYVLPAYKPAHLDAAGGAATPKSVPMSSTSNTWLVSVGPESVQTQIPLPYTPPFESTPPPEPQSMRRPLLPSFTLPPSSSSSAGASRSRGPTPLSSPHLATYRAPEEFEAGPSSLASYFDGEGRGPDDPEDMEAEHRRYFVDPYEDTQHETDDETRMATEGDIFEWNENVQDAIPPDEIDLDRPGLLDGLEELVREGPPPADMNGAQPAGIEGGEGRPPEPNEELDLNLEDDMDGALEAIGLRGPLHGVLQNAALMIFILNTTIGLGVWLPFTIGKSTALLSLNPRRFLQIVHLPLRIIRIVTDPIVDTVLLLINRLLLPPFLRGLYIVLGLLARVSGVFIGRHRVRKLIDLSITVYVRSSAIFGRLWGEAATLLSSKPDTPRPATSPSFIDKMLQEDSVVMQFLEPRFAPFGQTVRLTVGEAKVAWLRMTLGNGPNEKVFAIALGYAVVGLLLAIYLNVLTVGNMKNAGRAVRSAVRQQLLVIKVAAFIVIELVIFPLGCGLMLDACTVWLLPQSNFRSRTMYLFYAPVTSVFYHWVIGTMFMYQFAILLAGCRSIMRPGAMWFIKDPQDQNFHPIRDILERPTLVQLRKLLLSAVMYGLVVAAGVGTVSGVLQLFSRTILPFRWRTREPLSAVPIDLLFLHLVLPYTMQYFRPKKTLRQFGTYVWKYLASQFRLSSYMFGGRYSSEEFTPNHWSWRMLFIKSEVEMDDAEAIHDGTFRRVPNTDNVALVKDSPATAQVDQDGNPVDAEQARLIAVQNAEAEKAKRNVKDDYVVIYLPPQLKYRVIGFIACVWIIGSVLLGLLLGAPVLLGRGFLGLFIPHDVHDGYSFIAGFYLLWGCWFVGHTIDRMDKRRQRRGGNEPRAEWPLYLAKRSLLWIAQMSYMAFFLGFVIPTLIALVMEFYVVQPIRQITGPPKKLHINMVDMWALGLIYSKILIRCLRLQPENDFIRGFDHIKRQGWTHPDPFRATKEVIAPVTFGLLGMLLFPAGILHVLQRALALPMTDDFLFVHIYPSIFTIAGVGHAVVVLSKFIASWSQTIRDKEFLVEMRLQNHEAESEQEKEKDKGVETETREDEEEEEE